MSQDTESTTPPTSAGSGPWIFGGALLLAIAIGWHGYVTVQSRKAADRPVQKSRAEPAPDWEALMERLADDDGSAPAPPSPGLAPAGPDRLAYADGKGRIFLLRINEAGTLTLDRIYRLFEDTEHERIQNADRPVHDFYLDDLTEWTRREVAATRDAFEALLASPGLSVDDTKRAEELAHRLVRFGHIPYLVEQLKKDDYLARRSAAFALARNDYLVAAESLFSLASDESDSIADRARKELFRLLSLDSEADLKKARDRLDALSLDDPYRRKP